MIYQIMFPKAPGWTHKLPETPAAASAAIDALFAPGDGVAPCPEKLCAVTPCEENADWDGQAEVQDAIAKHLKNRYGVKTYQWLTEPYKPRLNIQADGWVFDAYHVQDPQKFYAHVESFVLTGVPVVPCIWAAGHSSKYHLDKTWDELTRFTAGSCQTEAENNVVKTALDIGEEVLTGLTGHLGNLVVVYMELFFEYAVDEFDLLLLNELQAVFTLFLFHLVLAVTVRVLLVVAENCGRYAECFAALCNGRFILCHYLFEKFRNCH